MNALSACILLVLIVVVLFGSRLWAALGLIAGILFLTQGVGVDVFGINFYSQRFLELAAFVRVIARGEFSFSRLTRIDRAFLLLYGYTTIIMLLRSRDASVAAIVAPSVDAFCSYFAFRGLLTSIPELKAFLRTLIILLVPYLGLVVHQRLSMNNNPFAVVGAKEKSSWRDGRVRASGSFQHPSLLGTFGASFLAIYIGLALSKVDGKRGKIGAGLCLAIVWATNSGAPASCALICMIGWSLWHFRTRMRLVRRAFIAFLILLALAMKAPIWYLLAKVSNVTGGDGYHRSKLMDVAFANLGKWWLVGMSRMETAHWFPYTLKSGVADLTNTYLLFGINAGLASMFLLIAVLVLAFKDIGKALAILRRGGETTRDAELICWGLGTMLLVHTFNWLSITYFDQFYIAWFMQLATISSVTQSIFNAEPVTADMNTTDTRSALLASRHLQTARGPLRPA